MAENWANSRHFIRLTGFLTIGHVSRGIPQAPGCPQILIAIAR